VLTTDCLTLPHGSTAVTTVLLGYARALLSRLWEPGTVYNKAGVVLNGLEPPGTGQQLSLLGTASASRPKNSVAAKVSAPDLPGLMASLNALNLRFGKGTVRLASAVPASRGSTAAGNRKPAPWEGKAQWCSPAFTTRLKDLLLIN
jgi:DNA polymerase V